MKPDSDAWVLVLAAGSGTRLGALTVGDDGVVVPKQYCSLRGGRSLLLDTIDRALQLAPAERVVVVVAAEHERWWRHQLTCLPLQNVVVQPQNRGTTAGILLPLARMLARDPAARVALLPSDHHVEQPAVLTAAVQQALRAVATDAERLVLLGIAPDGPDTEYGWIVPGDEHGRLQSVAAFVEKPPAARAAALLQGGALWNSFLFAADGGALWRLCAHHAPATAAAIAAASRLHPGAREVALAGVYQQLPTIDFSAVVLGRSAAQLRLLRVPPCGWTDLGTPPRVAECLAAMERARRGAPLRSPWFPTVDLARVVRRRLQAASA